MTSVRENISDWFKLVLFTSIFGWVFKRHLLGRVNMEKDIAMGPEAKLAIIQDGGKLVLKVDYQGAGLGSSLSINVDEKYFLEQLIPLVPSWAQYGIKLAEATLP